MNTPDNRTTLLKPLGDVWERVDAGRDDSDVTLFWNLMYAGEALLKLTTAAMVAAVADDRDRSRYGLLHRLVRADGIGEWAAVARDTVLGPSSQSLLRPALEEQQALTRRVDASTWQHEAVRLLHQCLRSVDPQADEMPTRVHGLTWFTIFAQLRNKSRGHGAPGHSTCSTVCPNLEASLSLLTRNLCLFGRQWVYLHRNLSGKYRVTPLTQDTAEFDSLKTTRSVSIPNGVYVWFGQPVWVELIQSTPEATAFFLPNGGFNGKAYETICYSSGDRSTADAGPYLHPTGNLPPSETQGLGDLDVIGNSFANLPPDRSHYVPRIDLEAELRGVLLNDYTSVVTIRGRGGIGKTWLALRVLHEIAKTERYFAIFWFSARDIDLLPTGPRPVAPHVLTREDVAKEFVRLTSPRETSESGFRPVEFMQSSLRGYQAGPILLVFDNFETFTNPSDMYAWMAAQVRLPNKILVTTRKEEFKGDYPIEALGMTEAESNLLMDQESRRLGIYDLLTQEMRQSIYDDSFGYPYVIKIFLGELAAKPELRKIEPVLATREDILDALFERTYASLSPSAKRVFLTLCARRTVVPELAVKAALLRSTNELIDVDEAVAELERSSMVEPLVSQADNGRFLFVPLAATIFGLGKLRVSTMKSAIEADIEFLRLFGAELPSGVRHGVQRGVVRLFRAVAERIGRQQMTLEDIRPTLELVSRQYPRGWILFADLYEETGGPTWRQQAAECIRRFLQIDQDTEDQRVAWSRLADLSRASGDHLGEVNALLSLSELPGGSIDVVSNAANRFNQLFSQGALALDTDEKRILVTRLVSVMENGIASGDATDCSRLAWLYMHLGNSAKARQYVVEGLRLDPTNEYCGSLLWRLDAQM